MSWDLVVCFSLQGTTGGVCSSQPPHQRQCLAPNNCCDIGTAWKHLWVVLPELPEPPLDKVFVDIACIAIGGIPWIHIMLNDLPFTAIVDTRAYIWVVSDDVVIWAGLPEVNSECPQLIMGEFTDVQTNWVVKPASSNRTLLRSMILPLWGVSEIWSFFVAILVAKLCCFWTSKTPS